MPKMTLTAQAIKGLPIPEKGRVDYQDLGVPGLVLRVSSTGAKSYSVSYFKDGKRPRVTLGLDESSPKRGPGADVERMTLKTARDKAKDTIKRALVGLDPAEAKRQRKAAITFGELADSYLKRHAQRKKTAKGAREDERRIEAVLKPLWGSWKAGDVRRHDVVRLLDTYEDDGKVYARNRMAALVSMIYSWGLKRDEPGLDGNPAAKLIDSDLETPRKRPLTDEELKIVLPLFRTEGLAGLGFRLLLLTAQRPAEVFGMKWSEIDGDVWSLPKARSKNRRSKHAPDYHKIPLSPAARVVLSDLRAFDKDTNDGYVFPSIRHGKPFVSYQKAARRVKAAAGLAEPWKIYHLKDSALTGMQDLGVAPHVVSAVGNHLVDSVTAHHYAAGTYEPEKREALTAWGEHVEKIDPSTMATVVRIRRQR